MTVLLGVINDEDNIYGPTVTAGITETLPKWPGAIRQQAITRANVDHYLCCHLSPLANNELMFEQRRLQLASVVIIHEK